MFHANHLQPMTNPAPRAPRGTLASRPRAHVQRLLHEHRITYAAVAAAAGVPASTAHRALSLRHAHQVAFGTVLRVRLVVESMLAARAVRLSALELWMPYDCAVLAELEAAA